MLAGLSIWRFRSPHRRLSASDRPVAAVGLYILLFAAMMTISPKKLDRYLMPAYPPLVILAAIVTAPWYPSFLPKGIARSREGSIPSARLNELVSIRKINPPDPRLSLANGHDLISAYQGPAKLQRALEQNEAQARSLASADFDEDGIPDLVGGYAYAGRGIITVHRGNADSIYPNTPEARQRKADGTFTAAPFVSPA